MSTTIKLKNGSGAPLAGDLVQGEPALDLTNKRLYTEDSGGTVIEIGTNPTSLTTGTFTSTGIDDNATSTAITIDSSESVGIGTASPSTILANVSASARGLAIESPVPAIAFKDTSATDDVGYIYQSTNNLHFLNYAGGDTIFSYGSSYTEAMRIDSSGDLLLGGTTSYTSFLSASTGNLQVNGGIIGEPGSGNAFEISNYRSAPITFLTSGNIERMRIDSSGNVGIGTASPSFLIEAYGATNASTGWNAGGTVTGFAQANTSNGDFRFGTTTSHAVGFYTQSIERMRISSSGNVGIGETAPSRALDIKSANPLNINTTSNNHIHFQVNDVTTGQYASSSSLPHQLCDSTGSSPRLVIDSSGNVGIGTSSPNASLHISQNPPVLALGSTGSSDPRLDFYDQGTTTVGASMFLDQSEDMLCLLRTASGNATDGIRIDSSGNVGIGTDDTGNAGLSVSRANGSNNVYARINGVATANEAGLQISDQNTLKWTVFKPGSSNNLAFYNHTGGSTAMTLDSSGNLLVGRTSQAGTDTGAVIQPGGSIRVYGNNEATVNTVQNAITNSNANNQDLIEFTVGQYQKTCMYVRNSGAGAGNPCSHIVFQYGAGTQAGSITSVGSTTTYGSGSDVRLKENIVDAPAGNIDAIRVRSFDWKADGTHQTYGMVAQELVDVAPEAVVRGQAEDDIWQVDYSKLVPMMIKEIQDLKAEVAALKGA